MTKTFTASAIAEEIREILSFAKNQEEVTQKLTELRKSAISEGTESKKIFDDILKRIRETYDEEVFDGLKLEFYYDFSDFQNSDDPYIEIVSQSDVFRFNQAFARIQKNAEEVGYKNFAKTFKAFQNTHKVKSNGGIGDVWLEIGENRKPKNTIDNFVKILEKDSHFTDLKIRYNNFAYAPEFTDISGKVCRWEDSDDAKAKHYIEKVYGIYSNQKYIDGLRIVHANNQYHPVQERIVSIQWDGKDRISDFLIKWVKCENSDYSREVSRLIFAGGIHRIFNSGCKFDLVPVLIGRQGSGKTMLCGMLAMNSDWYGKLSSVEDKKTAFESIQGRWIVEMEEMEALKKTKDEERIKAFISTEIDVLRLAYDRRATSHKRQCIFIGTSNYSRFIADKTGGRRWLPIEVHSDGRDLFHNQELIHDIQQCWAEAYAKINTDFMRPVENPELLGIIRQRQSEATEDDYRIGMIEDFIKDKSETCIKQLWHEALRADRLPTKKESAEIGLIMDNMQGWQRQNFPKTFSVYGRQRYWKKDVKQSEIIP